MLMGVTVQVLWEREFKFRGDGNMRIILIMLLFVVEGVVKIEIVY